MIKLESIKKLLTGLLVKNWDKNWKEEINTALTKEHNICNDLSDQIKCQANVWIKQFFNILDAQIQAHQLKAQLAVNDTTERVEEIWSLKLNLSFLFIIRHWARISARHRLLSPLFKLVILP